jgi:dienelactone hydrolase
LDRVTLPQGIYRWKIEREGYQTHECVANHSFEIHLQPMDSARDMVWVPSFSPDLPAAERGKPPEAPPFLIDKYEVRNEEYKAFVDAGGYDRAEYWTNILFIKDGRQVSWKEAVAEFRDPTGRPGPVTWADGTYPSGQGRNPVSGVNWFEAVAYSRFAGKSLPTVFHWQAAACLDESVVIVPFSNFGTLGTAPAGTHPGMGRTGLYDMAGNVKEWCLNPTDNSAQSRYILGGGWGEPTYLFTERDSRSPWNRSPQNGFRCVRLPNESESLSCLLAQPLPLRAWRDLSRLVPFSDEEFRTLRSFYEYDHTPLNAKIESSDNSSLFWRHEKITFNAAYGKDRVIAHLFLPKTGQSPYQTLIFFPGAGAIYDESFRGLPYKEVVEYFILSGRALLFPVYYGMYERPAALGRDWAMSSVPKTPFAYRDWTMCSVRDLSRSIDYLETRADIDHRKLAYYGLSHGAILGPIMLALENRLKTGILALGCIPPMELPRSFDMALYAQRVTVPVLVVNGREDFLIPVNEGQKPLYELLGSRDKKHSLYDGGHGEFGLFYKQIRQDVMAWLDGHLGPVQ